MEILFAEYVLPEGCESEITTKGDEVFTVTGEGATLSLEVDEGDYELTLFTVSVGGTPLRLIVSVSGENDCELSQDFSADT